MPSIPIKYFNSKNESLHTMTELQAQTPNTNKRKLDTPKAPSKAKKRVFEDKSMVFNDWMEQWKAVSANFAKINLSQHSSSGKKENNFLMLSQKSSKNRSKSKVIVHYKMLPTLIKQMQKFYVDLCMINEIDVEQFNENKLIIDEWDLNSEKSTYRKELAVVYAKLMVAFYFETSRQFCEGCIHDYPSQKNHDCLMMPVDDRIRLLFDLLFDKVDEEESNAMCLERLKSKGLQLNVEKISKSFLREDGEWINKVQELMNNDISS